MKNTMVLPLVAMLAACGGGGGESNPEGVNTGRFLDSAVANLSYTTPTMSGKTNGAGEFQYKPGETVVFAIGDTSLPEINAAAVNTPLEMGGTASADDPVVSNVIVLLQSLDADNDPSNGITIDAAAAAASAPITFDQPTSEFIQDAAVINMVSNAGQIAPGFVSVADARSHLQATVGALGDSYSVSTYQVTYDKYAQLPTPCVNEPLPAAHELVLIESRDSEGFSTFACYGADVSACVAWDLDDKGIYYSHGDVDVLEMLEGESGNLSGRWIIEIDESIGGGTTDCGHVVASPT